MKLVLEPYGQDCILILPPELVEKLGVEHGAEIEAAVSEDGSLVILPAAMSTPHTGHT
jgi:antitoxin component of MazEF toxin-antitoxin module